MKCFGQCGQDKAPCLFAPSEMKKERPQCIQCRKKLRAKYRNAVHGKTNGRGAEAWRESMKRHFI